jgi:hypothetical protein
MNTTNLRCRPGDLALVIRDTDAGKMVTCIELLDARERAAFGIGDDNGPVWRIDRDCQWADWRQGGREIPLPFCPDAALVPIRPPSASDDITAGRVARSQAASTTSPPGCKIA